MILAGGLGTRVREIAQQVPKALLPVAGRPFIERQLELLGSNGLHDVLLCTGYLSEKIQEHVGDGARFGMRVGYSVEPAGRLMGTGGALVNALSRLENEFLVMYGDSYLTFDFRPFISAAQSGSWRSLMTVNHNDGSLGVSNAAVSGTKVTYFRKKPELPCEYVDYGVSWFAREVFAGLALTPLPLDLAQIQSTLAAEGTLGAYLVSQNFHEAGSPQGLAELESFLAASETE